MFRKFNIILCFLLPNFLFSLQNLNEGMMMILVSNSIRKWTFNFVDYVSDINFISVHFVKKLNNNLMFFYRIDAINYGQFDGTDEIGNTISKFNFSQIITLGMSKYLGNNFTLGSNFRLLNSSLESYHSLVLSSNVSVTYHNKDNRFTSTFLVKEYGKTN